MKIRLKLFLVMAVFLLAFGIQYSFRIITNRKLNSISKELDYLANLERAYLQVQFSMAHLISQDYESSLEELQAGRLKLDALLKELDNQIYIRSLNSEMEDFFLRMGNMADLINERVTEFDRTQGNFQTETLNYLGSLRDFKLSSVFDPSMHTGENYEVFAYGIQKMIKSIVKTEEAFQIGSTLIVNNRDEVSRITDDLKRQSELYGDLLTAVLMILALLFVYILTRGIGNKLKDIGQNIEELSDGNLTVSFKTKHKDEIAGLSRHLQSFVEKLSSSIHDIQQISDENSRNREPLLNSTEMSRKSLIKVQNSIDSIEQEIKSLDSLSNTSYQSNKELSEELRILNSRIKQQMKIMDATSSSVSSMISSISELTALSDTNQQKNTELVQTVDAGSRAVSTTNDAVQNLASFIEDIQSFAQMIQDIASQTNLLSMNAAIEAAHAGDAGKGFSVVAEEIRKLAEASAVNSNDIARKLSDMTDRVEVAVDAGKVTSGAFGEINQRVQDVTYSFQEISTAARGLDEGGQSILETLQEMSSQSQDVGASADQMIIGAESVLESAEKYSDATQTVQKDISSITNEVKEIASAVESTAHIAQSVSRISRKLNDSLSGYKTEEVESSGNIDNPESLE